MSGENHQELLRRALVELRELRAKVKRLEGDAGEPIAVIGIGCRFPGGGEGPEAFWDLLQDGREAARPVSPSRWNLDALYDPEPGVEGKLYCLTAGLLDDVESFDADFFGISPREAQRMSPQQRLLLEVAWETLENAHIVPDRLFNSPTGVFVGACGFDFGPWSSGGVADIDTYMLTGGTTSVIAGRLSYLLGLTGPAMTIDTACSSSLVALHVACQSLRQKECDLALAGGVHVMTTPWLTLALCQIKALSRAGKCRAFDASADGYIRGEGCGLVALKRLSDAERDGDPILAVVAGSAVNQDGASGGLMVPSGPSQTKVIRRALAMAGVEPSEVDYVETHGPGTTLGDPIEVGALEVLYAGRSEEMALRIGSVKTNLGHLEAAAGIAGLIKTVLALQHSEMPASLHFEEPNPHIPWQRIPVRVVDEPTPWPAGESRRVAGVSAFGLSGTNAHVVLVEAPERRVEEPPRPHPVGVLTLSSRTREGLRDQARELARFLGARADRELADVCYTSNGFRSHFEHRLALPASDRATVRRQLEDFGSGRSVEDIASGVVSRQDAPAIVFLFPGQGPQYPHMARRLYDDLPVFRQSFDRCAEIVDSQLEAPLGEVIWGGDRTADLLDDALYTQPALFAVEYALVALWRSWGVEPTCVVGHSFGEYLAACVAGVFDLEDALRLVVARGRGMDGLRPDGRMAVVFADEKTTRGALAGLEDEVSIAALNGPENVVISGPEARLQEVAAALASRQVKSHLLRIRTCSHSPGIEPMLDEFGRVAATLSYSEPEIGIVSNLTGRAIGAEMTDPGYWVRHLREAVRFEPGIRSLVADLAGTGEGDARAVFMEISPKPTLVGMVSDCLGDSVFRAGGPQIDLVAGLDPDKDDWQSVAGALSRLYVAGAAVDWARVGAGQGCRAVGLPTYRFQRGRFPLPSISPDGMRAPERQAGTSDDWVVAIEWRPQPSPAPPEPDPAGRRLCCIFGDADGVGSRLVDRLVEVGVRCRLVLPGDAYRSTEGTTTIDPAEGGDFSRLVEDLASEADGGPVTFVYGWSLDPPAGAVPPPQDLERACRAVCEPLLFLVQAVASRRPADDSRIVGVTRAAQAVGGGSDGLALVQSPLWGLSRVLATEHPEMWGGIVDLALDGAPKDAETLRDEILADGREEVAYRSGRRYVARLSRVATEPSRRMTWDPEGSYWITGGHGGLGLELARHLCGKGVRHLVLIGRSEPSTAAKAVVEDLRARGAEVRSVQADVADPGGLRAILEVDGAEPRPVRGMFHLAGVVEDAALVGQTWEHFAASFAAKVVGAWNLHQLAVDLDVGQLVLFSSAASILGTAAQANHAAANAFLDGLAHHRRRLGLPGLSVSWGAWRDAGAAADPALLERLEGRGMGAMSTADGLRVLDELMCAERPHVGVSPMNWERFLGQVPEDRSRTLFAEMSVGPEAGTRSMREDLLAASPEHRLEMLEDCVADQVAAVLGIEDSGAIDRRRGFVDMGLDSLTNVELKNRLARRLEIALTSAAIYNYSSVRALSRFIADRLSGAESKAAEPEPGDAELSELAGLPTDNLEALLDEELAALDEEDV